MVYKKHVGTVPWCGGMYAILQCQFPCRGIEAIADEVVETSARMVTLLLLICHFHLVDGNILPVLGVFL